MIKFAENAGLSTIALALKKRIVSRIKQDTFYHNIKHPKPPGVTDVARCFTGKGFLKKLVVSSSIPTYAKVNKHTWQNLNFLGVIPNFTCKKTAFGQTLAKLFVELAQLSDGPLIKQQ